MPKRKSNKVFVPVVGANLVSNYNSNSGLKPPESYFDLLELANISVASEFAGIYMEELLRLSLRGLDSTWSHNDLWRLIQQCADSYLAEYPIIDRPAPHGPQANPVSGRFKNHEFLGCILQSASAEHADQFDGLKLLLIQLHLKPSTSNSNRIESSTEVRKGREVSPPHRLEVFELLPGMAEPDYLQGLAQVLRESSMLGGLHDTKKRYIRVLGRLVGLSLCETRSRKSQVVPSEINSEFVRPRRAPIRPLVIPGPADGGEPSDLYEIIEPPEDSGALTEEPPETGMVYQQFVDQSKFGFDVEPNQKRRQSAYWLEQATLVSPYNSGLLIPPECRRLCSIIRAKLQSDNEPTVFCAGLVALSYLTSLSINELLRDSAGNRFSVDGDYIRSVPQPVSRYKPSGGDVDEWSAPVGECSLALPRELCSWLSAYISAQGSVDAPSSIRSEVEVLKICRSILEDARDHGRYGLTESAVRNAIRRHLGLTALGALATYLITGRETERPPVIAHYASVTVQQLQDCYWEVLQELWL